MWRIWIVAVILILALNGHGEKKEMQFSDLLQKMASGQSLSPQEKDVLLLEARRMEEVSALITNMIQPGTSTLKVDHLIANDAQVNRAVITDAIIESATAGDGHVLITDVGIDIIEGGAAYLTFYDDDGVTPRSQVATDTGGLLIRSLITGENVRLGVKTTDASTPAVIWGEDAIQANRTLLSVADGVNGARLLLGDKVDIRAEGDSSGSTFMRMRETTTTPPAGSNDAFHMYMKGDKLIIQFDASGTAHYFYLDLTATSNQSWIYSATAP